jgi:hypothetical protein
LIAVRAQALAMFVALAAIAVDGRAFAQADELPPIGATETKPAPTTAPTANANTSVASEGATPSVAESDLLPKPIPEAPPTRPHKKGLVLEGSLGAMGFTGAFRHVAPAGPWMRVLLGYEPFNWLMVYGEGEMMFTDTSIAEDPTQARAFPILGFGGGVRFTAHFTPRAAIYLEGGAGALKADIAKDALSEIGFRDAETFGVFYGGRIGLEWYQIDRHLAIGVSGGARDATNFAGTIGNSSTPIFWDGAAFIRYVF